MFDNTHPDPSPDDHEQFHDYEVTAAIDQAYTLLGRGERIATYCRARGLEGKSVVYGDADYHKIKQAIRLIARFHARLFAVCCTTIPNDFTDPEVVEQIQRELMSAGQEYSKRLGVPLSEILSH
jgi:sugar phosphate isomerase/epimerase